MNIATIFIIAIVVIAAYLTIAPELGRFGINVPGVSSSTTTVEEQHDATGGNVWGSVDRSDPIIEPETPKETIVPPVGFIVSQLSPFYQKVRIGGVVPPPEDGNASEFSLYASGDIDAPISLGGWRVRSNTGGEVAIPNAIGDYDPFGTATEAPIMFGKDDFLTVRSEVRGTFTRNFRLNRCIGFLDGLYVFDPGLPWSCPALFNNEELTTLSGKCQAFIHSIGSCETPNSERWSESGVSNDTACRAIVDRFTYGECYRRFRNAEDFFADEWRAFTGVRMPFDPIHDRIVLFDSQRLVVDVYTY